RISASSISNDIAAAAERRPMVAGGETPGENAGSTITWPVGPRRRRRLFQGLRKASAPGYLRSPLRGCKASFELLFSVAERPGDGRQAIDGLHMVVYAMRRVATLDHRVATRRKRCGVIRTGVKTPAYHHLAATRRAFRQLIAQPLLFLRLRRARIAQ